MHEYNGSWQTVVDRTGLAGTYKVQFASSLPPDPIQSRAAGGTTVTSGGGQISQGMLAAISAPSPCEELDPAVFAPVQKLGLKLELGKAPVEMLVVEHAEKKPTP